MFNTIYVYEGDGVFPDALKQMLHTLKLLLPYFVQTISAKDLIESDWDQRAALFVMPGGADRFYSEALNGKGNQRIKRFVEDGGGYLGICGGSYYGGAYVDFARGTSLEVLGERELSFFPGVVKGPTLAPYNYFIEEGARAARIQTKEGNFYTVYYNGGGAFIGAKEENILAYYHTKDPAIVLYPFGKGFALLSGVHLEYETALLDQKDPYIEKFFHELEEGNGKRREFARDLILRICRKLP